MFLLDIPKLEAQLIADAEKRLSAFVAKEGTSVVPVETRTIMGDPFWEICQTAEREHTDLIVIGSHGRTGLAHVLLGSVAERGWSVTHPVPSSLPGAGLHNEGRRRPRKEVADSVEQQGLHLSGSHHRHHTEVGYD